MQPVALRSSAGLRTMVKAVLLAAAFVSFDRSSQSPRRRRMEANEPRSV